VTPEIHLHKGRPYIKILLRGGLYSDPGFQHTCDPAAWSYSVGPTRLIPVEFLRTSEVDAEGRVIFQEAPVDPAARDAMAREAYRLSGRA